MYYSTTTYGLRRIWCIHQIRLPGGAVRIYPPWLHTYELTSKRTIVSIDCLPVHELNNQRLSVLGMKSRRPYRLVVSKKVWYALAKCYLCFVFLLWRRQQRPWRPPGRPVAAFSGFAWSHQNAQSGNATCDVLPRWRGRRICRQKCYILFFRS